MIHHYNFTEYTLKKLKSQPTVTFYSSIIKQNKMMTGKEPRDKMLGQ